jgi:hypothetical protein
VVKAVGCGPTIREFDPHTSHYGRLAEWPIASVLKTEGCKSLVSSNLTPSSILPSSNGRTPDFGSGNLGSNPGGRAIDSLYAILYY